MCALVHCRRNWDAYSHRRAPSCCATVVRRTCQGVCIESSCVKHRVDTGGYLSARAGRGRVCGLQPPSACGHSLLRQRAGANQIGTPEVKRDLHSGSLTHCVNEVRVYLLSGSASGRSRRGRRHHDNWSWPHRVQQNLSFVIIPLRTIPYGHSRTTLDRTGTNSA